MWTQKLNLTNIRSFKSMDMTFSKGINILVGTNNSGKSTILKSVYLIQNNNRFQVTDLRKNENSGKINITLDGNTKKYFKQINPVTLSIDIPTKQRDLHFKNQKIQNAVLTPQDEPNNFIYPFFSLRKVSGFSEEINVGLSNQVTGTLEYLYSKIDRVSNPEYSHVYDYYTRACDEILGFRVTTSASQKGKKAVYIIKTFDQIPLDAMGDGVPNLLGLIVDLSLAENKLFLIEEPENDIHPKALKGLLRLIAKKSNNNQFIIATHSNIVTKYLGAEPNHKIFEVRMDFIDKLPTSTVTEIGNSPKERRNSLEKLGYDFFDFDLWCGWLFLEESSSEKIIREYLIPWFVPELKNKLRTFSARTISEIEIKFADFNRLFVFLHLEPSYKNRAWVLVDGGGQETKILDDLKEKYISSGWDKKQFLQLKEHNFEKYYPGNFQKEVEEVLGINDKKEKRDKKETLLKKVESWIAKDKEKAKTELKKTASEVIGLLRTINDSLKREVT